MPSPPRLARRRTQDPVAHLVRWLRKARRAGVHEPDAMTLATANRAGRPSARMVLLRARRARAHVLHQLPGRRAPIWRANPRAAAVFYWPVLGCQVRVEVGSRGSRPRIPTATSPRGRAGHGSPPPPRTQSRPIRDRATLLARYRVLARRYAGAMRASASLGWLSIEPRRDQFWRSRPYRLHDRIRYERGARVEDRAARPRTARAPCPSSAAARSTATRGFIRVLWTAPLWSVLAALFFGTVYGGTWAGYLAVYRVSLVFSYGVGLAIWAFEHFRAPGSARATAAPARPSGLGPGRLVRCRGHRRVPGIGVHRQRRRHATIPRFGAYRGDHRHVRAPLLRSRCGAGVRLHLLPRGRSGAPRTNASSRRRAASSARSCLRAFPRASASMCTGVNVPSRQVSGDFYDLVADGEHAFLIAIADVSGKGVPAALLSSMLQAALRTHAGERQSVGAILGRINRLVVERSPSSQSATFFLARFDEDGADPDPPPTPATTLPCCSARRRPTGDSPRARWHGGRLSRRRRVPRRDPYAPPRDRVLLYTDGISEATNAAREMFGEKRLAALVASLPQTLTTRGITERVLEAVRAFTGDGDPEDDNDPAGVARAARRSERGRRVDGDTRARRTLG